MIGMMKTTVIKGALLLTSLVTAQQNSVEAGSPRLNDLQLIGSHNSYKISIEKPLMDYLLQVNSATLSLEYGHLSLSEQLNLGLRSLELDVFHDPKGGYYLNPKGLTLVRDNGEEPLPFDTEGKLKEPGLKVFHIQDFDFRSHQLVFTDALRELRDWSSTHLGHTPIIITLNAKDADVPQTRKPLPFDGLALATIDREIRAVLSPDQLITPDLVKGDFKTLQEAVLTQGWPLLKDVGNRFLFVLDEGMDKADLYASQFPDLEGAVMFLNKAEGHPLSGFMIMNDPIKQFEAIQDLIRKGYLVRTRADSNTKEARTNDTAAFDKAKASGAQIISTDYYVPSTMFPSTYKVIFENGTYERIKELVGHVEK